jgi:peptidoglycan/LPS O-acetylase OafA/YrhL
VAGTAELERALAPAPEASRGERYANVDVLRAIAALGVLAIHAYALGGRNPPIKAQHAYDVPLITLATGVWLFFAISGFVIGRPFVERLLSGEPLPRLAAYGLRRAARIFPLYWLALTALIAIDGGQGTRPWQYPVHYLLLNNLVPGRQEALFPAAWTLTVEVLFYALLPVLAVAIAARRPHPSAAWLARLVLVSWGLSIAFTVFADCLGDGQIGLWLRGSLPAMWQMFCPGLLLAIASQLPAGRLRSIVVDLPRSRRAWVAPAALLLVVAAVLGAAAPLGFGITPYELLTDASRPLFALGYGLLLAVAIARPAWRSRFAVRLGVASYGIYLLHPVISDFLSREGLAPVGHDTLAAFVVNVCVLAALTIPLALVSWRWLERPAIEGASSTIGARGSQRADAQLLERSRA